MRHAYKGRPPLSTSTWYAAFAAARDAQHWACMRRRRWFRAGGKGPAAEWRTASKATIFYMMEMVHLALSETIATDPWIAEAA